MKNVKYLSLGIVTLCMIGFGGCAKGPKPAKIPEPQIVHDTTKPTGETIVRIPALNSVKTVEVGENMYQKINEYKYDTYDVKIIRPNGISDSEWYDSDFGQEIKNDSLNKHLYLWNSDKLKTVCRNNRSLCWVDANNTNQFTHEIDSSGKLDALNDDDKVDYKIIPTPPTYTEDSFKYQALYQGRIENKIKISFREFKDDMARPAFTQDIDYELNKSGDTIIGFKGLRIKVMKATNTDITYSVIQDYN